MLLWILRTICDYQILCWSFNHHLTHPLKREISIWISAETDRRMILTSLTPQTILKEMYTECVSKRGKKKRNDEIESVYSYDFVCIMEPVDVKNWHDVPIDIYCQIYNIRIVRRQQFVKEPSCRSRCYPFSGVNIRLQENGRIALWKWANVSLHLKNGQRLIVQSYEIT